MKTRRLRVVLSVAAAVVALAVALVVRDSRATANVGGAETCASVRGTARTLSSVNLSSSTPHAAGITVTLTAVGCTSPRVDAVATNGPAARASIMGRLNSSSALCVLSESPELPWGKLTITWKNVFGATIVNAAGRAVTDQVFVRLDPDGTERYDLHGFDIAGAYGGGDVAGELGFDRGAACGSGPTHWTVISDGALASTGEVVGGDGVADDLVVDVPSAQSPTTATLPQDTTATLPQQTTMTLPQQTTMTLPQQTTATLPPPTDTTETVPAPTTATLAPPTT